MTEKLNPCPRCKSNKICLKVSTSFSVWYQVKCENCGCQTNYSALKEFAIFYWNEGMISDEKTYRKSEGESDGEK